MFLQHGLSNDGALIAIEATPSGRTALHCPFCGQALIAKKGHINAHHFAHDGPTCAESTATAQASTIPFVDDPHGLPSAECQLLDKLARWRTFRLSWLSTKQTAVYHALLAADLLRPSDDPDRPVRLSPLAKRFVDHRRALRRIEDLSEYATLQEGLFAAKGRLLAHYDAHNGTRTAEFYRLRLAAVLQQHLYVLRVQLTQEHQSLPLYKVGQTRRDIETRMAEITRDLQAVGDVVSITVIGVYRHYGSLEARALSLLHPAQETLGQHTEYFCSTLASATLQRLNLVNLGKRVVNGPDCRVTYRDHVRKVQAGHRRAQLLHQRHLGRPEKSLRSLLLDHPDVTKAYEEGLSLRAARTRTGKAINTIRKVYDALRHPAD
ncbi:GIY-YIG nuclease family protein [Vibrio fluvialis]|uniref:GIY-YIG nuclease family protein n=1 Tax=Vibrio fluvialis TaxID=676 RepID=UPI00130283AA|nr:GIY-YIG nuclease family protein [Vibrio fluvialis]